jgi:hypothetical protein
MKIILKTMEEIYALLNLYYETIPNSNSQIISTKLLIKVADMKYYEVLKSLTEIG